MFEKGALLFPVVATSLMAAMFLVGGKCAVWQWWGSFLGVCAYLLALRDRSVKSRAFGALLFVLLMVLLWLLAGCWAGQSVDETEYRFPAVRMMMLGWNPVIESLPEMTRWSAEAFAGSRVWHIFYMARGVEMFCALFGVAIKTPLALSLALPLFLIPPVLFSLLDIPGFRRWQLLVGGLFVLGSLPLAEAVVDNVIFLSAIGLLASMYCALCGYSAPWLRLFVFSFWMMVAKQSSLCTCFVFWALFSCVWCWQRRTVLGRAVRSLAIIGGGLTVALLFVGASPYLTSWKNHGHPLYPTYTVASKPSPIDLTADFHIRNADARKMGHLGLFINAYVSETLSLAFYRFRYHTATFFPHCQTWEQGNKQGAWATSPTNTFTRGLLVCSTFLILLFGERRERWFLILPWCALFFSPSQYLGYIRYVPWWLFIPAFATFVMLRIVESFLVRLPSVLYVILSGAGFVAFLFRQVPAIDAAWELSPYLDEKRICRLIATKPSNIFNLNLLSQTLPTLRNVSVYETGRVPLSSSKEVLRPFLIPQVQIVVCERMLPRHSLLAKVNQNSSWVQRYLSYLWVLPRVYFIELPELLMRRVRQSLMD